MRMGDDDATQGKLQSIPCFKQNIVYSPTFHSYKSQNVYYDSKHRYSQVYLKAFNITISREAVKELVF